MCNTHAQLLLFRNLRDMNRIYLPNINLTLQHTIYTIYTYIIIMDICLQLFSL